MVSAKDSKFVRVTFGWVSTSAFIGWEITSLRLACKRNSDVYYITISASKSKTRSRRLVEMVPALAQWLEVYRQNEGPLWSQSEDTYQETFAALRESLRIPARRNGLRHAFCSFHFALHANENLTAQQAGNSPQQIHAHYRGLATKPEAEKWLATAPVPAAENVVPISAAVA